jgi:1-acyl-sn-glycerol-3-phosphate acyltransferase
MVVGFQLPVSITTKVVSLNPADGQVYSIQDYVIKFVSGFLRVLWFPPPIKTDHHDITKILLKVALNTIILTLILWCNSYLFYLFLAMMEIWPERCVPFAKRELLYAGPLGLALYLVGTIFIDRGNRERAVEAVSKSADQIKNHKVST